MSIATEIARLRQNVQDALDAIAAKGVTIPQGATSDDLATLIGQIDASVGPSTEIIVQEQSVTVSAMYTIISGFTEALLLDTEYIATINGVEYKATTRDFYGSVALILTGAPIFFEYDRALYLTCTNADNYGTYTIKIEKVLI